MDEPVTRDELRAVADIAEAALILAMMLASEHRLCDAPSGRETAFHARLERLRKSPMVLDSMDLRWALEVLAKVVPYDE